MILSRHSDFDGTVLAQAIRATFERRGTGIPAGLPLGLTDEFAHDDQKNKQWSAFQRKNALEPIALAAALAAGDGFDCQWRAGTGWGAS
ncbi:MAG: hypothetical protein RLZ63_929 [Pseudomonadota bacterium]